MTKSELSQLHFLQKEISEQERKLHQLEALATACTSKLSDMPHGTEKSERKNLIRLGNLARKLWI